MEITSFFHHDSSTYTHLLWDTDSREAAVIDPVLDFDYKSGRTHTESADLVIAKIDELGLTLRYILETHAHADHISAAPYIKHLRGGVLGIGRHIDQVQDVFKGVYNLGDLATDGSQFDRLLSEGDTLALGKLTITVLETPGHTPACVAYQIEDAVFIGDTFFSPQAGTARVDFPGGNAHQQYQSLTKLLALPDSTRLFLCHDYPAEGEVPVPMVTVAEQKARNIYLQGGSEQDYVTRRQARDATLDMPVLILPSIQVNIQAGQMPEPEDNGVSYLKLPLNQF
ncbi:MAG: MBL fold metallo-hydrolase [Porticoccaceae bacterium]